MMTDSQGDCGSKSPVCARIDLGLDPLSDVGPLDRPHVVVGLVDDGPPFLGTDEHEMGCVRRRRRGALPDMPPP